MILTSGNDNTWKQTCPSVILCTTNPTWTGLGMKECLMKALDNPVITGYYRPLLFRDGMLQRALLRNWLIKLQDGLSVPLQGWRVKGKESKNLLVLLGPWRWNQQTTLELWYLTTNQCFSIATSSKGHNYVPAETW